MRTYIDFGSQRIEFRLNYVDRKTLGISVTPEMEIIVNAPLSAPLQKVKDKVRQKAPWIIRQQHFFLAFYPKTPPRRYISGETHLYMGRQFQLKVKLGKKDQASYKGRFIEVTTNDKMKTKAILKRWYRSKAKEKFAEIAEPLIQRFEKYKVKPEGLYIQTMKSRWGSCTPKGKIILNTELIKAPKRCIEYVIIHELCHLIHHDHTQKFIDLQTKEMPDWAKWKRKLEELLA